MNKATALIAQHTDCRLSERPPNHQGFMFSHTWISLVKVVSSGY
jgi:hypothetical protein